MKKMLAAPAAAGVLLLGTASVADAQEAPAQEERAAKEDSDKTGLFGLIGLLGLAGVSTAEPPLDVAVSVAAKSSARVGNQISSTGSGELRRRSGCDVSAGECDAGDGDGYEAVDRQRDKGSAG
ncbi:hypothetical protein BH18ACT3_BH18ACT3_29130 [soil metagenome]